MNFNGICVVISDYKMTGFLCFWDMFICICLWDSKTTCEHYNSVHWPICQELQLREFKVVKIPLVQPRKILLPPFHIKLSLAKQSVKALDFGGDIFQ